MKKYLYFLALASMAFASCTKLPAVTPVASLMANGTGPAKTVQNVTLTLQQSDYALLASGYPKTSFTFNNANDAASYLPQILSAKYPLADNTSTATVTYSFTTQPALTFTPNADSLYNDEYYVLTNADYTLLPNNTFTDFSLAQMLSWLPDKYTGTLAPTANELRLIKFTPYPATLTPVPPYSYLYYNGAWKQIYTVQPAQYTQAGVGTYDQFTSTTANSATYDNTITGYVSFFLKNDISIMDTVKKNDIIFVSYDYYNSTTKITYQRVKPVEYDGSNFVTPYAYTAPAATVKLTLTNGTWAVGNGGVLTVVNHTLNAADETLIANSTVGGTTLSKYRGYVSQYGDFDVGTGEWTTAYLNQAFILVLQADFPTPTANIPYNITFNEYINSVDTATVFTYTWNGTTWVASQN